MDNRERENLRQALMKMMPGEAMFEAVKLYESGEEELGLEVLLKWLRSYRTLEDPHHEGKSKMVRHAIMRLKFLRDSRAAKDLIEVLGLYTIDAAQALAMIGGKDIEDELLPIASTRDLKGAGAVLALAYLKNPKALDLLIKLVTGFEAFYENKIRAVIGWHGYICLQYCDVLTALGSYREEKTENVFREKLTLQCLEWIIKWSSFQMLQYGPCERKNEFDFPCLNWEIWKRYGLDEVMTDEDLRWAASSWGLAPELDEMLTTLEGNERYRERMNGICQRAMNRLRGNK